MKSVEEKIKALPKWIRAHIEKLENQRDAAVDKLNHFLSEQIESPFYIDEFVFTGEESSSMTKRIYFNTQRNIKVQYAGIEVDISLYDQIIDFRYKYPDQLTGNVAMFPKAYQQFTLKALSRGV